MTEISFRSDFDVELIRAISGDLGIVQAARVSTQGKNEPFEDAPGLINHLMKARHGSPFEHNMMTFYVSAPIFVFREFQRHRIASYNEESARYKQLEPVFYVPPRERPLVQVGKPAAYTLVPGSKEMYEDVVIGIKRSCLDAYAEYEYLLAQGCAREIARVVLPGDIYSSMYVTMNARGLMNFLSLRVKDETSLFPSNPQWEIARVAAEMEEIWADLMPITHSAFQANGRVCP